jgi:hypothetical protein
MPSDEFDPSTLVAVQEAFGEFLDSLNALEPVLRQTLVMWVPGMGEHRSVRPGAPVRITGVSAMRREGEASVFRFYLEADTAQGKAFSQATPIEWIKLTHAVL